MVGKKVMILCDKKLSCDRGILMFREKLFSTLNLQMTSMDFLG